MAEVTDDDLVRLFLDGDADAFDALFARHHASVYNLARVMLRDDGAAEDELQETFLAAARWAGGYRMSGRFRAWLLQIARNRCLNRLRVLRAQKALLTAMRERSAVAPADAEPGASRRLETDEFAEAVRRAVEALPDRQREAMALYAYERMTYREIAEVLATPVNTVKTLIHRARAGLAEALGDRIEGADREL